MIYAYADARKLCYTKKNLPFAVSTCCVTWTDALKYPALDGKTWDWNPEHLYSAAKKTMDACYKGTEDGVGLGSVTPLVSGTARDVMLGQRRAGVCTSQCLGSGKVTCGRKD